MFFFILTHANLFSLDIKYLRACFEFTGGYAGIAMTSWNKVRKEFVGEKELEGFYSEYKEVSNAGTFNINLVNIMKTKWGIFGINIRYDYLSIINSNLKLYFDPEKTKIYVRESSVLRASYFGLGLRYYLFNSDNNHWLDVYVGVDEGLFFNWGNVGITYKDIIGNVSSHTNDKFNAISEPFWGGDYELGINLFLKELVGVTIKTGYRVAEGWVSGAGTYYIVDYSGFYIKGGVLINII